ncbi:YrhB domain-containing protein [Amycolatopsis sp. MJM2582]|uniref:YrhB domain-containing protein n=1 Tax=Amycolatopsis sp. MJM2582 TaxID=1427749 RepID=UPI00126A32F7|nr:YrhB domain-containing protein [Amycolatopsis sp. MJM2582]
MVSKEWAVEIVERHVSGWEVHGPDMVIIKVSPHRLGWVVHSQSERYLRSGEITDAVVGHGPFLVDAVDGSLHGLHATADLEQGEWIAEYPEQVRGIERHDPLRTRIIELTDRGRRFDALRLARASAPDLSPQEARDYVEAVAARMSAPEHIRPHLPRTRTGRRVCWRLSGPNPEPGTYTPHG